MNVLYFYLIIFLLVPLLIFAQKTPVQHANMPKDAQINVTITDMKNNPLNNEIVLFKSYANGTEYQGLSDSLGKFSLRVPAGARYDYFVLGFHDSLDYKTIDIPAVILKDNKFTTYTYDVKIQFEGPKSFVLDNCTFETGKAALKPEAYAVLNDLVDYLNRKDDERIEIGGHTDNVGKADANMILSTNRANAVRDYLLSKGIAPDRVTAKGYGMNEPIAENTTPEGRAQNRRTEVKVLE